MFHYFIESKVSAFEPELLKPIAYAFDKDPSKRQVNGGPGTHCGFVVSRDRSPGFYHDKQTWKPIIGKPGYWVGFDNERPPTPASLERPREEMLSGHFVRLDDGRRWHVPAAIRYEVDENDPDHIETVSNVRRVSGRDPITGRWVPGLEVVQRHAGIWKWAEWWFEFRRNSRETGFNEVTMEEFHTAAVEALAVNYYVSHDECEMLKIFSIESIAQVLNAVTDLPKFDEWYQKKTSTPSSGSDSVSGNSDADPSTDRPSPS